VAFVLRHFYNSDQLIVNNIYLEVWLENGFLAFCLFIGLWLWVLMKNWRHLIYTPNWTEPLIVLRLALVLTLQSYLIQWFFFSPLYIMPIFILLGLLLALDRQEQVQAPHNQNF
jgi:O-antigen ligase